MSQPMFCTGSRTGKIMSFEEWYENNEDEIYMYLAESGADREMGYDSGEYFDNFYEEYYEWADKHRTTK